MSRVQAADIDAKNSPEPSAPEPPLGSGNDSPTLRLDTPVQFVPRVGPDRADLLRRMKIHIAGDLLFHFPRDYKESAPQTSLHQFADSIPAAFTGTVMESETGNRSEGNSVYGMLLKNDSGYLRCVFFNQPFLVQKYRPGMRLMVSGRPKLIGLRWEMRHPEVTILGPDEAPPVGQLLPIYPSTDGLRQSHLRKALPPLVDTLAPQIPEVMPHRIRQMAAEHLHSVTRPAVESGASSNDEETVAAAKRKKRRGFDQEYVWPMDRPLPEMATALRGIHQPENVADMLESRTRFVFQELLVLQLALALRRRGLTTDLSAPPLTPTPQIDERIRARFPFDLTGDQQRSIEQIGRDMSRQFPMNRLVQGDVGSGKTVVALYAMLLAVANEYQSVLMAPTETLARQHFQTIRKFLEGSRVNVGLLCGSMRSGQRRETLQQIANGELQIVVGTQSLLHVDSGFHRLGLVVIDEQHKFGVGQRARLRSEGIDPHYLVLSATPIPRTMAMTQFGDLDVSTLRDKPPGRGKVNTYLAKDDWLGRWWDFVRERMREGRQCFVVAPRVDPDGDPHAASDQETTGNDSAGSVTTPNANTEKGDAIPGANSNNDGASSEEDSSVEDQRVVSSAVGWFDALSKNEFADYRVRLLHGRMPPEEKRQVMDQFVAGEVQMLVCTSLIEVGIDVANATVMTVLGAERFGLAQLHQLRGRVSRSRHEGHVAVFTDAATTPEENERLKVLAETNDGFEIAEADFRLRGPGDLLGTRQSGMPPMRVADLQRDVQVLAVAREMAIDLVDEDATLSAEDLAALRHQVLKKYGVALDLGDVA